MLGFPTFYSKSVTQKEEDMHSKITWRLSKPPNYEVNKNKLYPYSEIPYVGDYNLVRIPISNELIDLVDYWGEGRIVTEGGSSGFEDSYNVNHQYQLVSNGSDTDSKLPNRVPVISYVDCDTSGYIKDDSVKVVTLMGAPINKSCAKDIARMVNKEKGKVIIYGFSEKAADVKNLEAELKKKDFVFCFGYELSELFKKPSLFDSFRAYLNLKEVGDELYKSVNESLYDKAINISSALKTDNGGTISQVVGKLLDNSVYNVVDYAYKLWTNDKVFVKNYFPSVFQLLFEESLVKITNKKTSQPLQLNGDKQWKMIPVWDTNKILFKIYNPMHNMYLGLDLKIDASGDRKAYGYEIVGDDKVYRWKLEPMKEGDEVVFVIINVEYNQGIKFDDSPLPTETNDKEKNDYFSWIITAL